MSRSATSRPVAWLIGSALLAALVTGCFQNNSSDTDLSSIHSRCKNLAPTAAECLGVTEAGWRDICAVTLQPDSCLSGLESADCQGGANVDPALLDACSPSCATVGQTTCQTENTLYTCYMGTAALIDCEAFCARDGGTFATCGIQNKKQTADQARCWCDY